MLKKLNKKGFTLAELLIVVAIIGVLVAISIPIFTMQLRKARLATNQANARAAYAATVSGILDSKYVGGTATYTVSTATIGTVTEKTDEVNAGDVTTAISNWGVDDDMGGGKLGDTPYTSWTVTIDKDGKVVISGSAT